MGVAYRAAPGERHGVLELELVPAQQQVDAVLGGDGERPEVGAPHQHAVGAEAQRAQHVPPARTPPSASTRARPHGGGDVLDHRRGGDDAVELAAAVVGDDDTAHPVGDGGLGVGRAQHALHEDGQRREPGDPFEGGPGDGRVERGARRPGVREGVVLIGVGDVAPPAQGPDRRVDGDDDRLEPVVLRAADDPLDLAVGVGDVDLAPAGRRGRRGQSSGPWCWRTTPRTECRSAPRRGRPPTPRRGGRTHRTRTARAAGAPVPVAEERRRGADQAHVDAEAGHEPPHRPRPLVRVGGWTAVVS